MKICWIKAGGLVPLDFGGRIRSFHTVKALAERHEVSLFLFYRAQPNDPHPELRDLFHKLVLAPLRLPPSRSLRDAMLYAATFPSGLPHTMAKYYRPQVRRALSELLNADQFDVIVCDFVAPAGLLDWGGPVKTVLFTHNVEAEIWERQARVATSRAERLASRLEHRAMKRAEEKYLRLADHVVAVSERNKAVFAKSIPPERITVVSTGVDTDYFRPTPESELPDQVAFTASYDFMPNQDAAEWYFREILPLARQRVAGLVSWMVGKSPSASMQRFAADDPSYRITGRVDDVRPYMAQCPVYVVPMRGGSGTRLKIFEAMAAGKAVVSTPTGAEGLPVEHEHHILLAETADDFARQIARVLQDTALRRRLGEAARALVEEKFSWRKAGAEFEEILLRVTGTAPQER
jgi:glycosyltransferase involved in cell wall biosynthesis